jgi:hypothetical protein
LERSERVVIALVKEGASPLVEGELNSSVSERERVSVESITDVLKAHE